MRFETDTYDNIRYMWIRTAIASWARLLELAAYMEPGFDTKKQMIKEMMGHSSVSFSSARLVR